MISIPSKNFCMDIFRVDGGKEEYFLREIESSPQWSTPERTATIFYVSTGE